MIRIALKVKQMAEETRLQPETMSERSGYYKVALAFVDTDIVV